MAGTELMHARSQSTNGIHSNLAFPSDVKMEQPNGSVKGHNHSLSQSHVPPQQQQHHNQFQQTHSHTHSQSSISSSGGGGVGGVTSTAGMVPATTTHGNEGSSSRPTPTPPMLPQNLNGMVSLGAIIHRMSNEAFADLSNLSEILPSMTDVQRKRQILDYALSKREQFIKLLVLTKWAKSATKVQQCQNIIGFLQHENELFSRAVGGLFETYRTFARARVRNYDIPTAIDVLTTGTYQRLPSRIKQTYVDEEKPTRAEIASTLEKLDDVIRMRLLCDELVPPGMKYTVAKGKAKFVVPNEFEVTLTISGPGSPEEIPWRIVGLRLLVKPVGGAFQGLETSLNDMQMRSIIMSAQKELEAGPVSTAPRPGMAPNMAPPKAPANQALLRLYDFLHTMAQHLQIELVYLQALTLLRSGWTDRLRVEMNANRSVVRLVYWHNGLPMQSATVQPATPAVKRRTSTPASAAAALAKEQAANAQQEHYLEIKIEGSPRTLHQIPEGLAGALVDPKLLGYPKSQIKVVWSQIVKGHVSEKDVNSDLELDPSNLNTERLILKVVNKHAGQVMEGLYQRLWTYIDEVKGRSGQGSYISKDDVKMESVDADHASSTPSSVALSGGPLALLVRLKEDRWIRIRIDVRSGRVVVQEVGKTGDVDDPVIAAFQNRLNENANNIIESLISLRFSMSMVELESVGIQLGLQPYRRLALGRQDSLQFGANIQQILFLQYPQHPRHYLVVGVINQKFHVWLIEVAPTDRDIAGIWLTLKSIVPVYWQSLREQKNRREGQTVSRMMLSKRKSVQFDVEMSTEDEPSRDEEATIDQEILSKLETLCRVRVCHNEVKQQLQEHGIQFRHIPSARPKDVTMAKASANQDQDSPEHLLSMVPLFRLDPSSISSGPTDGIFQFVGAKLSGWWDSQRETCNFVIQAKFLPNVIPPNMESGPLGASEHYHSKTNTLSFTYKTRGSFIQQFKQDWETIVRMLYVIRQLHAPTLTNPYIKLDICHLHQVQLHYFGRYSINIKWLPVQTSEKRSSSGLVIPSAPRFKKGCYELSFSEIRTVKTIENTTGKTETPDSADLFVNPHRRLKYFLQDMFNREADLHSLMNTIVQTCSILEVLDRLEHTVKEDAMGTKLLSVVPRSAHHIRVVYGSKYALDIRAFSRTHLSIFDASFPSESYGSSLPPPPAPSTAPTLLAPAGRVIPPTTRGHLHFVPITNLQGAIGAIDVDKKDEEYIKSTTAMPSPTAQSPALGAPPTLSTAAIIAAAKSNMKKENSPLLAPATMTPNHTAQHVDPRDEPYELMPMPTGVICSRSASGRVLYRIAKHIESLL
ncbi:mediator complex subunit [Podila epigama]|nr:mediator complex subunit [Podila epigama]